MKKKHHDKQNKVRHSFQKYRHFSAFPLVLITLGIIFLLGNFDIVDNAFRKLWPLLIIVWGATMIMNAVMDKM